MPTGAPRARSEWLQGLIRAKCPVSDWRVSRARGPRVARSWAAARSDALWLGAGRPAARDQRRVAVLLRKLGQPDLRTGDQARGLRELAAGCDAKLAVDAARVAAHGLHPDLQGEGDLGVRATRLQQWRDFGLPLRQQFLTVHRRTGLGGHHSREHPQVARGEVDGVQHVARLGVLAQTRACSEREQLRALGHRGAVGEQDELGRWMCARELADLVEPDQRACIEDRYVGGVRLKDDGKPAVIDLGSDYLEAGVALDQLAQAPGEQILEAGESDGDGGLERHWLIAPIGTKARKGEPHLTRIYPAATPPDHPRGMATSVPFGPTRETWPAFSSARYSQRRCSSRPRRWPPRIGRRVITSQRRHGGTSPSDGSRTLGLPVSTRSCSPRPSPSAIGARCRAAARSPSTLTARWPPASIPKLTAGSRSTHRWGPTNWKRPRALIPNVRSGWPAGTGPRRRRRTRTGTCSASRSSTRWGTCSATSIP